jgi:hypothetical protein
LLLNQHRYDEMDAVDRQAAALEEAETRENISRRQQAFDDALMKVQWRHHTEKVILDHAHSVKRGQHLAAQNVDRRAVQQRIRNLEIEIEAASDPQKLWNLRHRNDAVELGKRPKIRSARTGKREVRIQDFNILNLPPLVELGRVKREAWTMSPATQQTTGQPPRYSWL